jgi:hypothetical protein
MQGTTVTGSDACDLDGVGGPLVTGRAFGVGLFGEMGVRAFVQNQTGPAIADAAAIDSDALFLPGAGFATVRLTLATNQLDSLFRGVGSISFGELAQDIRTDLSDPPGTLVYDADFMVERGVALALVAQLAAHAFENNGEGNSVGLMFQLQGIRVYDNTGDQLPLSLTTAEGRPFVSAFAPGDDSRGPLLPGDPSEVPEPHSALLLVSAALLYMVPRLRYIGRCRASVHTSPTRNH